MAEIVEVNDIQSRILGALSAEGEVKRDNAIEDEPVKENKESKESKENKKEVEEEVKEKTEEEEKKETIDKMKAAINKKKDLLNKTFDNMKDKGNELKDESNIDWKAKASEYENKVKEYETEKQKEQTYKEETEAYTTIKDALGSKYTPALDEAVAKLIDSETYDKLKNAGFNAQQRMLMVIQTAQGMVEEDSGKLVTETEKEIKDLGKLNIKEVKNGSYKRSASEAMKAFKQSGDDKDLQEAMGVQDMLEGMFNK